MLISQNIFEVLLITWLLLWHLLIYPFILGLYVSYFAFIHFLDMSRGFLYHAMFLKSTSSWAQSFWWIDMSGKGCQLLVSPCNVCPSLSMIKGHQSQSIRTSSPQGAHLSSCSGMEKVKKQVTRSFTSEKQGGSHVVLPSLSLRRQVLTNGKHLKMPTPSPHKQVPSHHTPTTAVTTTIQTGHCSLNNNFKGKKVKRNKVNPQCVRQM